MFGTEDQAWDRDDLFEEITLTNVEDFRAGGSDGVVEIVIRHPDLPVDLSFGRVYVRGSLESVCEAVGEGLSAIVGCMEAGVPETRRTALPPSRTRRAISGTLVALARLVRGGPIP